MFFEGREDGEYICRFQAGSPRRIGGKAALARGVLPLIFPVLLLVLVCSRVAVPALLWILLILSLAGLLCLTGPLTMGSCAMSLAALRGGIGAAHFSPVLPQ